MESADVHRSQTRDSDKSESDVCIIVCWLSRRGPLKNLIVETFLGDAIKR